jgi:hypothetical protein
MLMFVAPVFFAFWAAFRDDKNPAYKRTLVLWKNECVVQPWSQWTVGTNLGLGVTSVCGNLADLKWFVCHLVQL